MVVFEAARKVGGLCGSETVDGFTYDIAGGHILYSKEKPILDWMIQITQGGCARRDRSTKIRIDDRFVHYPFENGIGDLEKQQTFDCLMGYLRAAEHRKNHTKPPGNFGDWIRYRFGEGIERIFMRPYNEKIWKHTLESLSIDWVEGRVPDAPVEDVVRAAIGIRTEGYTHQSIFYYPLYGGFESITLGLAASLGNIIQLNHPIREVKRAGAGFKVNGMSFDRVVNTIPLPDFIHHVPDLDGATRAAIQELKYTSLTSVAVGLNHDRVPPYSWIYLPQASQGPANRITYLNNYSPHVAPPGKSLILAEATCAGVPRKDPAFVEEVVSGLANAGILNRSDVVMTHASTVKYAYVIFDHGFKSKIATALKGIDALGIDTLGRFGRFEYINSDHCVIRAFALADRMIADARSGRRTHDAIPQA